MSPRLEQLEAAIEAGQRELECGNCVEFLSRARLAVLLDAAIERRNQLRADELHDKILAHGEAISERLNRL